MAKQDLYAIHKVSETKWNVYKASPKFDVQEEFYTLERVGTKLSCTCFAGTKYTCRHREMFPEFQAEEAIDTNKWYWFDKKKWVVDEAANEGT